MSLALIVPACRAGRHRAIYAVASKVRRRSRTERHIHQQVSGTIDLNFDAAPTQLHCDATRRLSDALREMTDLLVTRPIAPANTEASPGAGTAPAARTRPSALRPRGPA